MARRASPIELLPVAQAVTTSVHLPLQPKSIATFPAAMLEIIKGISIGLTLFGPFVMIFSCSFSMLERPPIPEPMITPTRYGSSFSISRPAMANASLDAATAYWEKTSILLAALLSSLSFTLKSFTSAAIFTL